MVPKRKFKITQGGKDIVVDQYQPYNRLADPHLRKYLSRKQKAPGNEGMRSPQSEQPPNKFTAYGHNSSIDRFETLSHMSE